MPGAYRFRPWGFRLVREQKLERWSIDYNADRIHSSLGNLAPVEYERRRQKNRITEPRILNL